MKNSVRIVGVTLSLLLVSIGAQAGLLANTVNGITVVYSNVVEDITGYGDGTYSGSYGTPTAAGDAIDFNPSLVSYSTDGQEMETDAFLEFYVIAKDGFHITDLDFSESGDATLSGTGTSDTFAKATGTFFIDILEVDGNTAVNENGSHIEPFASFELTVNPGASLWSGTAMLDIQGILDANNVGYEFGATLIHISLDNLLHTNSELDTSARIRKKDADAFTVTAISVPEPASAGLMVGMAGVILFIRRRFNG